MGVGFGRKLLGLSAIVALSASTILADTNAAMLYAKGAVAVNGTAASRSAAVFAGDNVQTKADATVTISSEGSTLVLPANSSIVYHGDAVEVGAGTVHINTSRSMAAKVDDLTVKPANGSATFQVSKLNGTVTVAAERGNVVVSDGENTTVVSEGTAQSATQDQGASGHKNGKKRRAAWIFLGPAGAAGGAAAAIVTTGPPESPSRIK